VFICTLDATSRSWLWLAVKVLAIRKLRPGIKRTLPLMLSGVRAGFPSPADDYMDQPLDLNAHLIQHRAASFIVTARGDSMERAGIRDGALLIVDRSLEPRDGSIVVAIVAAELTVKKLRKKGGKCWLEAANEKYPVIAITDDDQIWGVVAHAILSF
jgi:DNA polymerase V